jgi:hypothetical protein
MRLVPECFFSKYFLRSLILESPIFLSMGCRTQVFFFLFERYLTPIVESQLGQVGSKTFSPPLSKGLGFCLGEGGDLKVLKVSPLG